MANLMPPLGLASIAAYLDKQNIEGTIVDCFARPDSDRLIRENLLTLQPAWIGISCTTSSFLDGIRIAKLAKGILPGIRVVFGGAHVSAMKEKILEAFSDVDFVVVGEGEQTLAELLQTRGCEPETLPGLIWRRPKILWMGSNLYLAMSPMIFILHNQLTVYFHRIRYLIQKSRSPQKLTCI